MKVWLSASVAAAALVASGASLAQQFRRPVACGSCIANWYYFDNDPGGGWEDWSCDDSSYNGHRGSDFSLSGGNDAIDNGYDIVAADDGVVVRAEDGHFDHCTSCGGAGCGTDYGWGYGNHVTIDHGNYSVTYAHMRTGSVAVGVGDAVTCGQVLGQIGSSGCSTGAHLHFEVRPRGGEYTTAFDPFQGPCSPTSPSLWTDQNAHRTMPSAECGDPPPTCPEGTSETWACIDDDTARRRCIDGEDEIEGCPSGCISNPEGIDDVCSSITDSDGDGYAADEDCDDEDMTRYPGAPEVCDDGIDQDCDGSDLECPDVPPDADGDGYRMDTDCDDSDPSRYPGAVEFCEDGVDQDCDGRDGTCSGDDPVEGDLQPLRGGCRCEVAHRRQGLIVALLRLLGL